MRGIVAQGISVGLLHVCKGTELDSVDNNRLVVLRYLRNGRVLVNDQLVPKRDAPDLTAQIMSRRLEPVVWFSADSHLDYGQVVLAISQLKQASPHLVVLLATESQTGPIDPSEIAKQDAPKIVTLCQPTLPYSLLSQ